MFNGDCNGPGQGNPGPLTVRVMNNNIWEPEAHISEAQVWSKNATDNKPKAPFSQATVVSDSASSPPGSYNDGQPDLPAAGGAALAQPSVQGASAAAGQAAPAGKSPGTSGQGGTVNGQCAVAQYGQYQCISGQYTICNYVINGQPPGACLRWSLMQQEWYLQYRHFDSLAGHPWRLSQLRPI